MIEYDPKVIRQFADMRYKQANRVILFMKSIGALVGGFLGAYFGSTIQAENPVIVMVGLAIVAAPPGGFIGNIFGSMHALSLRLDVQRSLCQVQIEENTRVPQTDTLNPDVGE